jgi:hypothetical protein
MLRRVTDEDMNRRNGLRFRIGRVVVFFDGGLNAVPQKLADHVFQVRRYIGEDGIEVAFDDDFWDRRIFAIRFTGQLLRETTAIFNNFFGVAAEEYFTDKVGMVVIGGVGGGEVKGGVEGVG